LLTNAIPSDPNFTIAMIGLALLVGWAAGMICRQVKVPMVVGYIVVGIILGKSLLGIFNDNNFPALVYFTYIALAAIGFDIGGELAFRKLKKLGKSIIWISLLESFGATLLVTIAVYLYTRKLYMALVFGALASATAPAATVDVLREYQTSGPLTTTVFAVVGIDDAIAIIIYAFSIFVAKALLSSSDVHISEALLKPSIEIIGALGMGFVIGIIFLFLIRNYTARRGLMVLTLGVIILTTGLSNLFHYSLILANMALGLTIVNVTKWRRSDVFELMRGITPALFVIFFIIVGAQLQAGKLLSLGWLGLLYIAFRSLGKQTGALLGGIIANAPSAVRRYLGLCLFSQAGVAIGLSIQTMIEFGAGQYGDAGIELGMIAISVIAATTLFFQLIGPPSTRYAVIKAKEVNI
jgi:Kef-type K+ transport system membrane component KefB